MSKFSKTKLAASVLASSVLLSGCGLLGGDKTAQEIDPPQDVSYLEEGAKDKAATAKEQAGDQAKDKKEEVAETVKREIYLIDKNGFVVPQTINLPKTQGVAKQVLEYLVVNGPVENMLPDGFRAVIPQDTQVSVNVKDGTAIADFSKDFASYKPEDELKILQAITYTLTQFDNIKTVKLRINGHDLEQMPVNNTPIEDGMSRSDGINLDNSNAMDITNTHPVTVYFLSENGDQKYYVPVTRRVENAEKDNIAAVIKELVEGPELSSGLVSGFQPDAKLLDTPKYENGKVTLNFNEAILGSFKEKKISKDVLESIVLSLTEQKGIESVAIQVNGSGKLVNEEGKPLTEPVTRPQNVNTGSF